MCGWVELCKHWPDSRGAEICQMGREQPRKKAVHKRYEIQMVYGDVHP